ncbi:TSUP family transporter [Solirubrobacter phytolaccae]|uniref:Probable membrane transporter protein n=1 Tax=Solirubrobacter phytolaccae TaxID=1404360 RepID=A0A9X3NDJ9_9ACTN|nr:TSUP family transporter [Solirubrobacter phytolaccae]MDA0182111.1 TSUP family transporter [Solirubrobacter phytolaccae]
MSFVVLALAAVVCAAIQRAIGVGYSLVLLPAAIAVLPDGQAVPCVLAAGVLLSVGLLVASRGRPQLDDVTRGLLAFAPVGQLVALLVLGGLRGTELRVAAAAVLLLGCAAALIGRRGPRRPPGRVGGAVAGLGMGAVGALTAVIGPFVALLLTLEAGTGGDALRRRLWLCTAVLGSTALAFAALLGTSDVHGALVAVALSPALFVGAVAGTPLAGRLEPRAHRLTVLAIAAAGAATLLAGA